MVSGKSEIRGLVKSRRKLQIGTVNQFIENVLGNRQSFAVTIWKPKQAW